MVLFIGTGSMCGFLAGFFGIGGGILLVPILTLFYHSRGVTDDILMQLTFGTSLAVALLASIASACQHHRQNSLSWQAVGIMAAGSIVGAWAGSSIAVHTSGVILKIIFSCILVSAAARMLFEKQPVSANNNPKPSLLWVLAGFVSGFVAPLAGVGGGIVLVPLMIYVLRFPVKKAVGTSCGVIVFTALISTFKYIYHGWQHPSLPDGCLGFVCPTAVLILGFGSVLLAPLGAKWNQKIKGSYFKKIFSILLFIVSMKILFTSVY